MREWERKGEDLRGEIVRKEVKRDEQSGKI